MTAKARADAAPAPDLDCWLPAPTVRVAHQRTSAATADVLWQAARTVRLEDTSVLGRLVRWRIPDLASELTYDQLFRHPPFLVLHAGERSLISGLVGRIWTLHRDYPELEEPRAFHAWSVGGTARVLFANWVQASDGGGAVLHSETRVHAIGRRAHLGLATLRPVIRAFQHHILSDGISAASRAAESSPSTQRSRTTVA